MRRGAWQVATAHCGVLAALALFASFASAEPPAIADFAEFPNLSGVNLSPDGRRIVFLQGSGIGYPVAIVHELDVPGSKPTLIASSVPGKFAVNWCRWKTSQRLLCGYRGTDAIAGHFFPVSRLLAVDADGGHMRVLVQNGRAGVSQYQDRVLDWLPADPTHVLVQVDDDGDGFPGVFALDVNDGSLQWRLRQRPPMLEFTTDANGVVRLGCGFRETTISCEVRDGEGAPWRTLVKFEAFARTSGTVLRPIGFGADPNLLYMRGSHEGRRAVWRVDLTDREPPQLEFSHPVVDVDDAEVLRDGRLIAVYYDTDRPFAYYLDAPTRAVVETLHKVLPESFNTVISRSDDDGRLLIHARSDIDAGSYYLYDRQSGQLRRLGRAHAGLDPAALAHVRAIEYPARDGTAIPGYLTVPPGMRGEHLPLIVMPHGGPLSRDRWRFDFLVQFLASRGYAVLQMNFRGSAGYGEDWQYAAHQDWGGLTYDDIVDGTRWAIAKGIADPARVAIVGWSFGGYAALLGATRDSDLFRCAVSIAGVSDLVGLLEDERMYTKYAISRREIGTDPDKLKRDSPRRHAADVRVPVLLVHGTRDWQAHPDQSRDMASALKAARKPVELLLIEDAGHQFDVERDRATLLTALERFLRANLGSSAGAGVAAPPP